MSSTDTFLEQFEQYKAHPKQRPHDFLKLDNIKHLIDGYARIIYYQVYSYEADQKTYNPFINPRKNRLVQMREGQFKNGLSHGYARTMDFQNDVSVGYFYQGKAFGKVQFY